MTIRDLRWANLAAVAAPVLVALLIVYSWMSAWTDATSRQLEAENQIRRLAWLAEHQEELRKRFAEVKSDPQHAAAYLPTASDDEATAELQRLVKQTIDGSNAGILSAQPLPATADGDFKVLAARFQISVTSPGLVKLLTSLENSTPYIFVESAEISTQQTSYGVEAALGDPTQRPLIVQIDVRALMLTDNHG
jgi:hypothetical protein